MMESRREVIKAAALGTTARLIGNSKLWAGANDRIRIAIMGMGGRGGDLMTSSFKLNGIEVAAICDPDESRMRTWAASHEALSDRRPRTEPDIRRILEDKNVDAILISCCNHWHALAGIWACQAGKHVYVEKPISHEVAAGRALTKAARRYNRCVQGGTENRSNIRMQKAVKLLHEGVIGDVYMARWIIAAHREPIGFRQPEPPPSELHWDLWLGPSPDQPFHRNLVHYNWHWFWDFGNGEMGNNGTHYMDIARFGLNVGLPVRVHSIGGRYGYKDQAETPNTQTATFEYPDGKILACDIRGDYTGEESGWWFYGTEGSMWMRGNGEFSVYWQINKSPDQIRGYSKEMDEGKVVSLANATSLHLANFYDAIRANDYKRLRGEIEEIHQSCALCLLANIAYRVGRQLDFDPKTEQFRDGDANTLLSRAYRKPYSIPEKL
jgi:predicted dehydrogenase